MLIALQVIIILTCLVIGAHRGGMALGLIAGVGLLILVFAFRLEPGSPPVSVILTILAVIGCAATLQQSGGLDVMMQFAEKILRRHPEQITIHHPGPADHMDPDGPVRHRARGLHHAADHCRYLH